MTAIGQDDEFTILQTPGRRDGLFRIHDAVLLADD